MSTTAVLHWAELPSADRQRRRQRVAWWRLYATTLFAVLVFGFVGYATAPSVFGLAALLFVLGLLATLANPLIGVYLVTVLTLIGDRVVASWYPFAKNFSSRESVLFIHEAIVFSPLEVYLVATAVAWIVVERSTGRFELVRGQLLVPLVAFAGLVLLGLVRALATAYDTTVALVEARPLAYLALFYVLVTNLVRTREHYVGLFMAAMAAVTVHSLIALRYFTSLEDEVRVDLESLIEHSAAVHITTLWLMLLAAVLVRGCPPRLRLALLVLAAPTFVAFLISERRAAVVAFGVGVLVFMAVLARRQPRTVAWFLPLVACLVAGYTAAFWNSQGALGFPAQAIKTVIAPDQLSQADRSSDLYRLIESYNIWFTIRAQPIFGIGFGQPFYRPVALPDISFFVYANYYPHNSVLWVWMKLGWVGFVLFIYWTMRGLQEGVRNAIRSARPLDVVVITAATGYVVMYLIDSYVEITWDARSTIFLALALAVCADFPRLASGRSSSAMPQPEVVG